MHEHETTNVSQHVYCGGLFHSITVRGHSVLWALKESNPTWVQDKTGSLLWRKIDTRIVYVIDHYKGTLVSLRSSLFHPHILYSLHYRICESTDHVYGLMGLLDYQAEDILRSEGKAEDVQIEWTEAEVYSNIDLDLSFAKSMCFHTATYRSFLSFCVRDGRQRIIPSDPFWQLEWRE